MWCFLEEALNILQPYTPTSTVHPIFGPKTMFGCWHELLSRLKWSVLHLNVNIETPFLIPGEKIFAPLLSPVQEVKLVRPLKRFFLIHISVMCYALTFLKNQTKLFKMILYSLFGPYKLALYLALT
jgi:hypothetical protein